MGASRAKILFQATVKAEETDEEKWTKLEGRISNANIVNQIVISRLLTSEFWLHSWKSGSFRASWGICTCSCHSPIVTAGYPWCDNLIALGCHRILRELYVHFEFQVGRPWTKLAEIWSPMLSERSPTKLTKLCLRILIIPLIKKLCLFFRGKFYSFLFSNFILM